MKLSISMTGLERVLGWCFMAAQLLVLPLFIVLVNLWLDLRLSEAAMNLILFAVNLALTAGIFHRFLGQSAQRSLSAPWHCLRTAVFGLAIYYILSMAVNMVIGAIAPDFSNVNDQSIGAMAAEHYTLIAVATVLMVPITEEALYRGLIFCGLHGKSRAGAYLVSMAVFAAIHVLGYIGYTDLLTLALCFVQYLPAGFALCWAYERADSIWAPILMHMTINQIAMSSLR